MALILNRISDCAGRWKVKPLRSQTGALRMFSARGLLVIIAVILLSVTPTIAEENEKEPLTIIELGGTGDWNLSGGSRFGPSAGLEFEPIKNWLEIEANVGTLFGNGPDEFETEIMFKKPFSLADKLELEIGAGPQWAQTFNGRGTLGVEFEAEFLFWPTRERNYGWFIEPNYAHSFGSEHEQSLGVSLGLLIPIRAN
jgi:hypothetical protein